MKIALTRWPRHGADVRVLYNIEGNELYTFWPGYDGFGFTMREIEGLDYLIATFSPKKSPTHIQWALEQLDESDILDLILNEQQISFENLPDANRDTSFATPTELTLDTI